MLEKGTKVFGEWMIEETIGSGAFGTVYKIKRVEFGEVYFAALKVINIPQDPQDQMRLRSEGMDNESINTYYGQLAQNFIQEIKLLSSLDGITNIVDYKDHSVVQNGDLGYTIYIKMQLLTPLSKKLLDDNGKAVFLSSEEVLTIGTDICSALEVCEKNKIIHRDIKIDNIFVSANGDYKLGDFGIAKQLESTQSEMSKKGTMMYMAPEVFKGETYNKTADIYSLGIVLYRLLNKNRAPFFPQYPVPIKFSDKEIANIQRLNGADLPAIPDVSDEFMAVLRKACAFDPAERYQCAADFKKDLQKIVIIKPDDALDETGVLTEADDGLADTAPLLEFDDAFESEDTQLFEAEPVYDYSLEDTALFESIVEPEPGDTQLLEAEQSYDFSAKSEPVLPYSGESDLPEMLPDFDYALEETELFEDAVNYDLADTGILEAPPVTDENFEVAEREIPEFSEEKQPAEITDTEEVKNTKADKKTKKVRKPKKRKKIFIALIAFLILVLGVAIWFFIDFNYVGGLIN